MSNEKTGNEKYVPKSFEEVGGIGGFIFRQSMKRAREKKRSNKKKDKRRFFYKRR